MRIKRLELENFRGFQKASVNFPEGNVAVFFGWNGAGKTAVLDAVAIVFRSIFQRSIPFGFGWKDDDILIGENKASINAKYFLLGEDESFSSELPLGNSPTWTLPSHRLTEDIQPLVVYYKTNREVVDSDYRGTSSVRIDMNSGRTSGYNYTIDAGINTFSDFIAWFRYEEDLENQQKLENQDLKYQSPRLKTIRQAISVFLSKMNADYSDLKVQRQSNGEVDFSKPSSNSELYIQKAGQKLKLSQLSFGERSLILLVADIARRATILNPQMPDPLQSPGVVLIDEIELHLHPKWQRAVIPALQATFPNIQFIIATHSPQVLSEVENGGVFEIENFQIHPRDTYGRDNNWLLHVIMEDDERPEEVQQDLEEYFALLRNGQLDAAARLRQQIEEKIGTDEPEFVKADILLRRKERALAS
ncbi:MAG: AAA family ATPase [Saprospiraceae bacterium]